MLRSISKDLKEVRYIWKKRGASRRKGRTGRTMKSKRKQALLAVGLSCKFFFFPFLFFFLLFIVSEMKRHHRILNIGMTCFDFLKESLWLLHGECNTGDTLILKKNFVVYLNFSFNGVSCIFTCYTWQP